jgi:transposase
MGSNTHKIMYSPDISQADAVSAKYYKKHASNPVIRDRMNVIYLRSKGLGPGSCAIAAGVSPNSVTRWSKKYQEEGIEALLHIAYYQPKSDLHGFVEMIKSSFGKNPPRSIGEARKRIYQLTGLKRGITQIKQFIKTVLNFRYRKYRPLPGGKRTIAELISLQADFIDKTLQPLIERAKRGSIDLFFVDAAHPVQGFHDGHVWSEEPRCVRTGSGRQRVNILGALHAISRTLFSITTTDYISAPSVVDLMAFLRSESHGRSIHLVLDNARYQRCDLVTRAAKRYKINLVYLPPYSPNLNLIERFWKYMKTTALAGVYHETKAIFQEVVNSFIDEVNSGIHDEELSTLLTLNFQTLQNDR